jgi:hypothetical protein
MPSRALRRRGAALVALTAVLACSGLGVCWLSFAVRPHACCDQAGSSMEPRSCASPAVVVAGVMLAPPIAVHMILPPIAPVPRPLDGALSPVLPAKPPPLVLRI